MSASHAVSVFLRNITDPDYATTVTFCLNSDALLDSCINAIRKQEREIQQKKQARYRLKAVLRRYKSKSDNSDDDKPSPTKKAQQVEVVTPEKADKAENSKFEGKLDTTGKGLLRFKTDCWNKMEDANKEFVREYNAAVKHGEPTEKVTMPKGISVKNKIRRTTTQDVVVKPSALKKKKGVTFGISDADHGETQDK
jgi:hypothetical protein